MLVIIIAEAAQIARKLERYFIGSENPEWNKIYK